MTTIDEAARKEIEKMRKVMQSLKIVAGKQEDEQTGELKKLIDSYWIDARHFLEKKQFLEAFEAAVICWAYIDAGIHLGVFEVEDGVKEFFTI